MRSGVVAVAVAVAVALVASTAWAQERDAVRLLRAGVELRAARRESEALVAFERAWALCRCDEAMAQRGLAEQAMGRWGEAAERLDSLAASTDPWVAGNRAYLARARAVIGRHVGVVVLRVDVAGARVSVSGRSRGAVGAEARRLMVDAGEAELRVEAEGHAGVTRVVSVTAGAEVAVEVTLAEPRVEEAVVPEPVAATATTAATERVEPRVVVPVERTGARRSLAPLAWGVGSVAVAAGVGGAVALVLRNEALTRYNAPGCVTVFASRDENCGELRRAAEIDEALAVTGFVVGGVGAVVTTVLVVRERAAGRRERAWTCGPSGGVGVVCAGVF